MEKLTWFKFSISDWIMGKIMKCPEVTQARFLKLCCLYWNKECSLSIEDAEIEIDEEHLNILKSKKVIIFDGENITIKFLDEQWSDILETSEKRRDAVKQRWEKVKQNDTSVSKNNTSVLQIDTDKIRVEENRVDKIRKEETIKEKCRLSYESNSCEFGTPFKKVWFELIGQPKWFKKNQSAINKALKQIVSYDETFAIALVEKSIAGNYQGIVFAETENHYKKYLSEKNGKQTSTQSAIESRSVMAELATKILTGNQA